MQRHGKQIQNKTITNAHLNLSAPVAKSDPITLEYFQNSIFGLDTKPSVRVATTGNIVLSGLFPVDTITLNEGDFVLVHKQDNKSENGIFVARNDAWSRRSDSVQGLLSSGATVFVSEGVTYGKYTFSLQTPDPITVGTTALNFDVVNFIKPAVPTTSNKGMQALVTTVDFDKACNTPIAHTPSSDGYVRVLVRGDAQLLGNGVKTDDCYFSSDNGVTAKLIKDISAGDILYWVGSKAGFQLDNEDRIDYDYNV